MKKTFKNLLSIVAASLFPVFALAGCTEPAVNNEPEPEPEPDKITWNIYPSILNYDAAGSAQDLEIKITSGHIDLDFKKIEISVNSKGQGWITWESAENKIKVTAAPSDYAVPRDATLSVKFENSSRNVQINQLAKESSEYDVIDEKITILSATGTSENTTLDAGVNNYGFFTDSFDGKHNTWFNSRYGAITEWPFFLEYTLETPNTLNYIMYYPRSDSGNKWGSFDKFDVYITTEDNPEKVLITSMERGSPNHTPCRISLQEPAENVKTVYFEIHAAYENRVSCAEMEFHQVSGGFDFSGIFADALCTKLKPEVTEDDIKKIPVEPYRLLAEGLFAKSYEDQFRIAEFRPYQHPDVMRVSNRIYHAYSLRDNPTGIYVKEGEVFYVIVEDTKGQDLSLVVQNLNLGWGSNKTLQLLKGENRFTAPNAGLLYVMNHTNDPIPLILETEQQKAAAAAKTVKMHFVNGNVQGYYRKGETKLADWKSMVETAAYREIDVVGDYAHLTWLVADYKAIPDNIALIVSRLDQLVLLEQEFAGLVKHGKVFSNRMYIMHINSGNPSATMYRTNYLSSYSEIFTTPARFDDRLWVLGHEVGHINQVHGMKWAGTTEVTNNIYSAYVQRKMAPDKTPRLFAPYSASEATWDDVKYDDIYQAAIAAIVTAKNPHCLDNGSSQFYMKLVPFWQLYLYLVEARGKTDYWADLYEYYRTCTPNASTLPHGEQQLLFVEKTCEIANLDLTEFFEKWGFLRAVDKTIDDYGNKQIKITQAQVDAAKARIAAAGYPAAPHTADQIIAIHERNVEKYKN